MTPPKATPKDDPGPVQASMMPERRVRVHQETSRSSRIYSLEFTDGERTWREPLWSVTTLLKSLDKPALVYWAARETARAAFANLRYLATDLERFGEREAIYQLSQAPWSQRDKAADVGSAVHALIDAHVRGAELPPLDEAVREKATRHFEQFKLWEAEYRPVWRGAEMTVVNPEHGWAGTLDELCEIGTRGLGLIDVKNTAPGGRKKDEPGVYPEMALQCSAYAHATEIIPLRGVWAEPVPMPEVHWGAVLWLAEDRYAFVEVDISAETYRIFRIAAEAYRWQDGPGKRVVIGEQSPATFGILPTPEEQAVAAGAAAAALSDEKVARIEQEDRDAPVINEAQRKRMLKIGANHGMDHAAVKALVAKETGATSTTLVPLDLYDQVIAAIEGKADPGSDTPPRGEEAA